MEYMENNFTRRALSVLKSATEKAKSNGTYLYPEHILLEILGLERSSCFKILSANVDISIAKKLVVQSLNERKAAGYDSRDVDAVIDEAKRLSKSFENEYIGVEHLLLGILSLKQQNFQKYFKEYNIDFSVVTQKLSDSVNLNKPEESEMETAGGVKEESSSPKRSFLAQFGVDLVELARRGKGPTVSARDSEIDRTIRSLCRRQKNCPVLVGEAGVGKTAVVHGIAQRIAELDVPDQIKNKTIIELDMGLVIAGTKYRGQFEERIKKIMEEVAEEKEIIVFLDEIHTLIGAGSAEGTMDAANILKPALARGEFPCIGATTLSEYRKYIEKDSALERRFQKVDVCEPDKSSAAEMIKGSIGYYEDFHKVKVSDDLITLAVDLSDKFISDRFLPDKAFDIIDEACVLASCSNEQIEKSDELLKLDSIRLEKKKALDKQKYEKVSELKKVEEQLKKAIKDESQHFYSILAADDIFKVTSEIAKVPIENVRGSFDTNRIDISSVLKSNVIGQDHAIEKIWMALRKSQTPLKDANRPIGSFLFSGPTGVGKTLLAKNIAEHFFGKKSAFIKFDMSEYQTKESVNKMIGGSPSYVGYEEGGQLVNKVRNNPHSLVLFDEIEKAHYEVMDILLQIMEDGELTDNKGKRADFRNSIIVMTSNVGGLIDTSKPEKSLGFGAEETYKDYGKAARKECERYFSAEFINRLSDVVVFNKLPESVFDQIVQVELHKIVDRLKSSGINLSLTPKALKKISKDSFSEKYGAREVRRVLEENIENKLVEEMFSGKIKSGDTVCFELKSDKLYHLIS